MQKQSLRIYCVHPEHRTRAGRVAVWHSVKRAAAARAASFVVRRSNLGIQYGWLPWLARSLAISSDERRWPLASLEASAAARAPSSL